MTVDEIKRVIEPLLPLNEGEKIEAELTYTKTETPAKELLDSLKGTPAAIKKTHTLMCELGINYGKTKYAGFKRAQAEQKAKDAEAAGTPLAPKKARANNKVWDIQDILGTNSKTGNSNLEIYVDKSSKWIISSQYEVTYEDGTVENMEVLSDRAKAMRRPEKPYPVELDANGSEMHMPLVTIGIDKISRLEPKKTTGRYIVGED